MDTDRINRWLSLVANIAVLIGIALLILELGQNREMMRAQIRNEISRGAYDMMSLTAGNREMAEVVARFNREDELTDTDLIMLGTRSEAMFRYWENVHYQYRLGMYDQAEFSTHLATMKDVLLFIEPHLTEFWCDRGSRGHYSVPFTEEIDRLLPKGACKLEDVL